MMSLQGISVEFKEVWSNNYKMIRLNPYWTCEQMLWTVKPLIKQLFRLENYDIEIVPINQMYNLLHGIIPELAPKLVESNLAIHNLWGSRLNVSFYVRRKRFAYPRLAELNIVIDECDNCAAETYIRCHHVCSHKICETCFCKFNLKNETCCICHPRIIKK